MALEREKCKQSQRGVEKEEGKTFKKMCEYKGKEGI